MQNQITEYITKITEERIAALLANPVTDHYEFSQPSEGQNRYMHDLLNDREDWKEIVEAATKGTATFFPVDRKRASRIIWWIKEGPASGMPRKNSNRDFDRAANGMD